MLDLTGLREHGGKCLQVAINEVSTVSIDGQTFCTEYRHGVCPMSASTNAITIHLIAVHKWSGVLFIAGTSCERLHNLNLGVAQDLQWLRDRTLWNYAYRDE